MIFEFKDVKFWRVVFCVDVEIVLMLKYVDVEIILKFKLVVNGLKKKFIEKGEGEVLKNLKSVEEEKNVGVDFLILIIKV